MKRFLGKLILFLAINGCLAIVILFYASGKNSDIRLNIDSTESNFFVIGSRDHYGMVLLGSSRGRVFSRDGNHRVVEGILKEDVANLSKGGGGGVMPMDVHLNRFYEKGNTTQDIVYLLDPFALLAPINNEKNNFFLRDEPFELPVLLHLLRDRFPLEKIVAYLQMIAPHDWAKISRYQEPGMAFRTLAAIKPEEQKKARKYYLSSYQGGDPQRYLDYLRAIVDMGHAHGSRVSVVLLPILMHDFPGATQVDKELRVLAKEKNIHYYNMIGAMQDRSFFYDHMHFNRHGVSYFSTHVLLPISQGAEPDVPCVSAAISRKLRL